MFVESRGLQATLQAALLSEPPVKFGSNLQLTSSCQCRQYPNFIDAADAGTLAVSVTI
jgi:hypothetical protein